MRRNEAHNLILRDQMEEKAMESRVSKVESDIANIQLDVRELRSDVTDLKVAYATLDGKIDVLHEKVDALSGRVEANAAAAGASLEMLEARIDANAKATDARFEEVEAKIDANAKSTDAKFEATQKELGALRIELRESIASVKATIWTFGVLRALISIGFTAAKAFHWIYTPKPGARCATATHSFRAICRAAVQRLTRWTDRNTDAAR